MRNSNNNKKLKLLLIFVCFAALLSCLQLLLLHQGKGALIISNGGVGREGFYSFWCSITAEFTFNLGALKAEMPALNNNNTRTIRRWIKRDG